MVNQRPCKCREAENANAALSAYRARRSSVYIHRSVAPKSSCWIGNRSCLLLLDSSKSTKMVTSSFSLDTSVVNGAYKDRRSTCIATVEAGALEQRVSAPRAGCLLDSIWSLLVLTVLFSLLYYIIGCTSAAKPVLVRRPRESRNVRCLRPP